MTIVTKVRVELGLGVSIVVRMVPLSLFTRKTYRVPSQATVYLALCGPLCAIQALASCNYKAAIYLDYLVR